MTRPDEAELDARDLERGDLRPRASCARMIVEALALMLLAFFVGAALSLLGAGLGK